MRSCDAIPSCSQKRVPKLRRYHTIGPNRMPGGNGIKKGNFLHSKAIEQV
jgi:hypothetical protein